MAQTLSTEIEPSQDILKMYTNSRSKQIDWKKCSKHCAASTSDPTQTTNFINQYKDKLDWNILSQSMNVEQLEQFKNFLNWKRVSKNQNLTEIFIRRYISKLDCKLLSQHMNIELLEQIASIHTNRLEWKNVSKNQNLTEIFIRKYSAFLDWKIITQFQFTKLSHACIEKYDYKLDWEYISQHHVLTEEFIELFQARVRWHLISQYQRMSKEFVLKFKDRININAVNMNRMLDFTVEKRYKKSYVVSENSSECVVCYAETNIQTSCILPSGDSAGHYVCQECLGKLETLECPYCRGNIYENSELVFKEI